MRSAETSIRRNPLIKKIFSSKGEVYLVGGYIRDRLLGISSRDIDIAVKGISARRFAQSIQKSTGGTVFDLRGEHIVRVAIRGGKTIDVSNLEETIEKNLKQRDFTVNSIAWTPERGIIDPYGGIKDLNAKILRANLKQNMIDDPLRCLRIYRFMSCFELVPTDQTRKWARDLSISMKKVATERITLELLKLLDGKSWETALKWAIEDGVLGRIIPLKNSLLESNLNLISKVFRKPDKSLLRMNLRSVTHGLVGGALIRLEGLVLGAELARLRLSLSSQISRRLEAINSCYLAASMLSQKSERSNRVKLFDLFEKTGEVTPDLLILARKGWAQEKFRRYKRISERPLRGLIADEIMQAAGIVEGPEVGVILREIRRKRFLGEVKSARDGKRYLASLSS